MRKAFTFILILTIISYVSALQKPTNYYAANSADGGVRGNQQQANDFAIWNATSQDWANVIPPVIGGGTLNGIVAVGTGLLAYGSFTSINGKNPAAGLAYYDGNVWAAPEGVGLYSLGGFGTGSYNSTFSFFDNVPSGVGVAFGAVVDSNNNVYVYGTFDQVGLCRTGVAGFVQLQWSAGGIFTIKQIGNGYYKTIITVPPTAPCTYCVGDPVNVPSPISGNYNKMKYYTNPTSGNLVFVIQQSSPGDLWQWEVNTPNWVQITYGNGATNLTGVVMDYDIASGSNSIFVVGNFQRLNDPNSQFRYQHIALSQNNGQSFCAFGTALNQTLFGYQPAVYNQYGVIIQPAYTANGFYSVAAQSTTNVFVAGSVRDGFRQTGQGDAYPNEAATRVFQISSSGGYQQSTQSERFAPYSTGGASQSVGGPSINRMIINGNMLMVFGSFSYYRQVASTSSFRFGTRFTNVYKNAAVLNINANTWSPAFGGYITTTSGGDVSPTFAPGQLIYVSVGSVSGNTLVYFAGTSIIGSTYGLLSGAMFAYGGDPLNNANNRWNAIFGNNRLVSFGSVAPTTTISFMTGPNLVPQPYGSNGQVRSLLVLAANDAIIFGGNFDYLGNMQVPGIGFWNQDQQIIGSVGGGLFYYNNIPYYQSDNIYNNRIGGVVNDIAEYNNYLYAAGYFNRNNSGNSLSNIAAISYRTGGAGWTQLDGGCDQTINDILIVNGLLYVTGSFQYCGLNSAGYNGGLFRGRSPTPGIAVIDLTQSGTSQGWRPLGIGLQSGAGWALTYRRGYLYVGGAFSSAGGVLNSNGIAKWDGNGWSDVVSACQGQCDRTATNRLPFIGLNYIPSAADRKPTACYALSTLQGNVWCINSTSSPFAVGNLAWFDGTNWFQAGTLSVSTGIQNSVIVTNQSNSGSILVPGSTTIQANGNNFFSWNTGLNNYENSFTGFSVPPTAMAAGSLVVVSQLLVALCLIVSFVFFF